MLDGLLGRGFSCKCKALIKQTRTRIDASRRNKDARQRIMKKDITDLLANGLDINAFGRTEEYIAGLCLLFCYDFIEGSCEFILKQLSVMQKQRECPKECREAVSSLMFAAARFSDLPELRDLRDMFQERYGNSLEYFVNQKFVEKVASKPPTMEEKLQLLQDIALEFSIMWDCWGFEQRMATPPAFTQDQPWKYGPLHVTDDKYKLPNGNDSVPRTHKPGISSKEKVELVNDRHKIRNGLEGNVLRDQLDLHCLGRQEFTNNEYRPHASRGNTIPRRDKRDIPIHARREFNADKHEKLNVKETALKTVRSMSPSCGIKAEYVDDGHKLQNDWINIASGKDGQELLSHGKLEAAVCSKSEVKDVSSASYHHREQHNIVSSESSTQKEEIDGPKSLYSNALPPPYVKSKDKVIPPPYVKLRDGKYEASAGSKNSDSDCDGTSIDPSSHNGANAERSQVESECPKHEGQVFGPVRIDRNGYEKDHHFQYDMPLPKPRSVRRKHPKSTSQGDLGNFEDAGVVKRSSGSRRRENSRRGLQQDEEERMIDKLLLHYSKKPSNYEPGMVRKKSKAPPSDHTTAYAGDSLQNRSQDWPGAETEMVPHHTRSVSLPRKQTAAPTEVNKAFARANSFQPDNQARHVHPKLPDYDDLAARFAALRGR
ncbi:uncharacterized protein LOC132277209 [Cornus florida]|uniref:uncharacterized protein LOC132277209 n=1 Tax=Cornus florida TaxID=4283 RepID=UPI0028A1EE2D|nr:uncharacterized protein LOC132277209 [Cornus florida]XP_059634972.1 uncharacterized protein LOC132277209 [Cornus florida]